MKRLFRIRISLVGFGIGVSIARALCQFLEEGEVLSSFSSMAVLAVNLGLYLFFGLIFAFLFYLMSERIQKHFARIINGSEAELRSVPMSDILFGCLGMLLGLLIAYLITRLLNMLLVPSWLLLPLSLAVYVILGYLGAQLFYKRWRELPGISNMRRAYDQRHTQRNPDAVPGESGGLPKILDTSVIIDGRILDICATGFVDGPLIVPSVVLDELRHIADSSDAIKRNRGRRGLDILQKMQKELDIELRIDDRDFEDADEVDVKLLHLANALGGCVVTNDYNLNKVAGVSGIKVLNVNDLANAVKPILIPGEELTVNVLKEGKEPGQGVAYLEDGTMIVIDNARQCIGESQEIVVTSVLQTSAGRMIFARLKNAQAF